MIAKLKPRGDVRPDAMAMFSRIDICSQMPARGSWNMRAIIGARAWIGATLKINHGIDSNAIGGYASATFQLGPWKTTPSFMLLNWNGAHCCWWSRVYHYDRPRHRYVTVRHFWGEATSLPHLRADGGLPVFVSRDGGVTYQPWSQGLTQLRITALAVSPAYREDRLVYALSLGGALWRRRD